MKWTCCLSKKAFIVPCRSLVVMLFLLGLAALLPPCSNCAELRPYELPSQKRVPYQQQYYSPVNKPASASFDYEAFGTRAAKLPPEERAKLKEGLQERMNCALEEKNYKEADYYEKLFKIINNIK